MTLIHLDGADHLEVSNVAFKYITVNNLAHTAPGRYGIGAYLSLNNGATTVRRDIAPADTDDFLVVGFALRHSGSWTATTPLLTFRSDAAATQHVGIYPGHAGGTGFITWRAFRGTTAGTLLGTSSSVTDVLNEWHYYEIKILLHDSTGTVDIRRDGVSILSLTGLDTKNAGTEAVFSSVQWAQCGANTTHAIDDIYICNGAGALNNDFLDEIVVETRYPDGNGTNSDLLGSDANSVNNYLLVDEVTTNDADYVGSAVVTDKDTYTHQNLVRTDGDIVGIAVNQRLTKSDAGAKSARRVLITDDGGATPTEDTGADIALVTPHAWTIEIIEENPVLSSAWDQAAINDLEVGIEVRT